MESITGEELEQLKLNGEKILVDFYGTWCGPCKQLLPRLDSMSHHYPNIKFVKIDVDQNTETAISYGVRGIPTVMVFDGINELYRESGVRPDNEYEEVLNTL
jgi:thioredoxin 1